MKIYCPGCRWEPLPESEWQCAMPCGSVWNTFDTGGRCPQCGKVWQETQCLRCGLWSKHHDWYHDLQPIDELLEKGVKKVKV
jgi:hypothetical protein